MTEVEWLASTEPAPMLAFVGGRASPRKLWLYACACCRRIWDLLPDPLCRRPVEVGEQYADGKATYADLLLASSEAYHWGTEMSRDELTWEAVRAACFAVVDPTVNDIPRLSVAETTLRTAEQVIRVLTLAANADPAAAVACSQQAARERRAQADLLREIIGNPFRARAVPSYWLTPAVCALARRIYAEQACERLPELAQSLDDAGCTDAELLAHCREPGAHPRGCWAVDLVLGKE